MSTTKLLRRFVCKTGRETVRELDFDKKRSLKIERKKKLNDDLYSLPITLTRFFLKVSFRINEHGKGKIVIPFENPEEMNAFLVFDRPNPEKYYLYRAIKMPGSAVVLLI